MALRSFPPFSSLSPLERPRRRLRDRLALLGISLVLTACADMQASRSLEAAETETRSPLGAYLAGSSAMRSGDLNTAADFLETALAADPTNQDLLRRTLSVLVGEGRMKEAIDISNRLVVIEPNAPLALLVLGLDEAKANRYVAAEGKLEREPPTGVNNLSMPLLRAWLSAGQKKPDAAVATLKPLADAGGFSGLHDFHLGLIQTLSGNNAGAAETFARTVAADNGAPSFRVVQTVGAFYERTGKTLEARALYDDFSRRNPDTTLLEPTYQRLEQKKQPPAPVTTATDGMAEALFDVASILQREQPGGELALIYAQLGLWLRPTAPLAQMLLSDIYETQNRPAKAMAVYRAITPDSGFAWVARQRIAADKAALGDTDGAIADLRAMAAERPKRYEALVQIGDILRSKEKFAEAVPPYDEAVTRIGKIEQQHWSILFNRAVALERSKQIDRAIADLQAALALQPDQPYLLNYLGYTWAERGQNLPDAKRMIGRAVELRPNDGSIVDSLGWVYFQTGDYENAVKWLERAVELRAQDPTINDHLGDAYWRVGRINEARIQWRRTLSLEPDADLTKAVTQKLDAGLPAEQTPKMGGDTSAPDTKKQ